MSNRLPYAGWVSMMLRYPSELDEQERRGSYFSNSGRRKQYPYYLAYCQENGREADAPPKGVEIPKSSADAWVIMGLGFIASLGYFLAGVIGAGTGRSRSPGE